MDRIGCLQLRAGGPNGALAPGDRPGCRACADVAAPEAGAAPVRLGVTCTLPRVIHAPEPRTGPGSGAGCAVPLE